MIIVKIFGGLGNQLFQYAAARGLGLRSNTEVKLDVTDPLIKDEKGRLYGLNHFNITTPMATEDEVSHLLNKNIWLQKKSKYLQNKIGVALHKTWWNQTYVYQEEYDKCMVSKVTKDIYLNGYWQNEDFFKEYRSIILNELSVKNEPDAINLSVIENMRKVNAISLHVRRGDAVSNPYAFRLYKLPSLEYYKNAINLITQKVKDPYFFIFSDDIDWCKKNLQLNFPVEFIGNNNTDDKNYEDIRLMSCCKHHITANSTFSWWGAWLNPSDSKIVISPAEWFHKRQYNKAKIVPRNWIRLS
jgi:hypothetical protein